MPAAVQRTVIHVPELTGRNRCKAEIARYVQVYVDAAASGLLRVGATARLGAHPVEQSHLTNQNWSAVFVITRPRRYVIEHPRESRPFGLQKTWLNAVAVHGRVRIFV